MYENGKMINYSRNGGKKDKRMMVGVNWTMTYSKNFCKCCNVSLAWQ
jgi:hypothetical protein